MPKMPAALDALRVASPCTVSWEGMTGDDRVRHCGECRLNVYNLSSMTRPEAEALVRGREGRLCVRFFRRPDGTVLTRDCPVGLAAVRRRLSRIGAALAAAFLGIFAAGCGPSRAGPGNPSPAGGTADPAPLMGDVCLPSDLQPTQGEAQAPEPGPGSLLLPVPPPR